LRSRLTDGTGLTLTFMYEAFGTVISALRKLFATYKSRFTLYGTTQHKTTKTSMHSHLPTANRQAEYYFLPIQATLSLSVFVLTCRWPASANSSMSKPFKNNLTCRVVTCCIIWSDLKGRFTLYGTTRHNTRKTSLYSHLPAVTEKIFSSNSKRQSFFCLCRYLSAASYSEIEHVKTIQKYFCHVVSCRAA
jgi:hypothetical protein